MLDSGIEALTFPARLIKLLARITVLTHTRYVIWEDQQF